MSSNESITPPTPPTTELLSPGHKLKTESLLRSLNVRLLHREHNLLGIFVATARPTEYLSNLAAKPHRIADAFETLASNQINMNPRNKEPQACLHEQRSPVFRRMVATQPSTCILTVNPSVVRFSQQRKTATQHSSVNRRPEPLAIV
jgi:hypothetical protein